MDKLLFGLSVALIGMLVVFVGLVILIGCIKLIKYVAMGKTVKESASTADTAVTAVEELAPVSPQAASANIIGDLPAETLIAITTAILSVWQEESGFVVRHVRRVNNAPAWNRAGRDDQVYSRM